MGPENPQQPEAGPIGWAVKLDGVISIRTASTRPEGAMVNGLVLFFGVDPYQTGHEDMEKADELVRQWWEKALAEGQRLGHEISVVRVLCSELPDATAD